MRLFHLLTLLTGFLLASPAHAQWQSTTYTLKGGWSSIYLSGDASHAAIGDLFPATVTEVWRWNPNPNQVQFTESPLIPSAGTADWSVWRRGAPADSSFTEMIGRSAYLVKSTGTIADTYTVTIKQSPLPPGSSWVRNGANFLGFPAFGTAATAPTISSYFNTFPAAVAANAKVFKYVGGELGPGNPLLVFSTGSERLDRSQAYWFSAQVVENFYGPVEINLSNANGLDFGRTGSVITAKVRNRGASPVTLTFAPVSSEASPTGQAAITGPVPLSRRVFNPLTLLWTETPLGSGFTQVIAAQSTVELQFGLSRGAMNGGTASLYASMLRVTDAGQLMDLVLPVRAQPASLTGLWIGDVKLTGVESKAAGSTGTTTPEPFLLRTLIHVADGGRPTLLSQVFLGQLAVAPHAQGVCTQEALLKQDAKSSATRLVAAHLPLDLVGAPYSPTPPQQGVLLQPVLLQPITLTQPGSVIFEVTVPFNDPTNPFVHQYHPDHDNKDPRGDALIAGQESYTLVRKCTFTFTASPPAGSTVSSGWGSSVIGGNYTETITGAHSEEISVSGTFELSRASEVGTLSQ